MRTWQRRLLRRPVGVACVGMVCLFGAGWGSLSASSDSFPGTSTPGTSVSQTKAPAGSPIKVFVFVSENNPVLDAPWAFAGARAATDEINAAGGVNGHPVKLTTCNELGNPNAAVHCATQAASGGYAVAFSAGAEFGALEVPILQKAGIPFVTEPISGPELTNPDSFPIANFAMEFAAFGSAAKKAGVSGVFTTLTYSVAAALPLAKLVERGAVAVGFKDGGIVTVSPAAPDYSPTIQRLKDKGSAAVGMVVAPPGAVQAIRAASNVAFQTAWVVDGAPMDPHNMKLLGQLSDGAVVAEVVPPWDATSRYPSLATFNASMKRLSAAGVRGADNPGESAVASWLAIHGIGKVAATIQGSVTASAMTTALRHAHNVDIKGILQWSPGAPGPAAYPRTDNSTVFLAKVANGHNMLVGKVNMYQVLKLK